MYKEILKILCCPICHNKFKLTIEKEDALSIIEGKLYCDNCNKIYPIENSIPNTLENVIILYKKDYTPLTEPLDIYANRSK